MVLLALAAVVAGYGMHLQKAMETRDKEASKEAREAKEKRQREGTALSEYLARFGYIESYVLPDGVLEKMLNRGDSFDAIREFIEEKLKAPGHLALGRDQTGADVILPALIRDKHIYVVGKSGYGKTNFLRNLIRQDLLSENGIGVLAPEYELLTQEIMPLIPDTRIADVIYFNPTDGEQPVVFNPLHLFPGENIDRQVDEAYTILQRVFGEGGARMDEILRHTLYALVERPGSTLLDIEPLLDRTDSKFRNEIIRSTKNERTRRYFSNTYPQVSKDAHLPILNRVGRIISNEYARNCLCPTPNSSMSEAEVSRRLLNIREAMDSRKIMLFNLSDGLIGEAATGVIGQMIVAKFQSAVMKRADTLKEQRVPFYLYLDEFQVFCGTAAKSYETILSRARKYKLGMILAHQQTSQIPSSLMDEIFGNVSTLVAFQVDDSDAVKIGHRFFGRGNTESSNALARMKIGSSMCRIAESSFPLYVSKAMEGTDKSRVATIVERSRTNYGIPSSLSPEAKSEGEAAAKARADAKPMPEESDPLADLDPGDMF